MVSEVRIYLEGGGQGPSSIWLRRGFSCFFNELVSLARSRRIHWQIVASGSRNDAFSDFSTALQTHPDALNVLLVDAEGPVQAGLQPYNHLREQDRWDCPQTDNAHYHLMVQVMEAWFLADLDALRQFYGKPSMRMCCRAVRTWKRFQGSG